MSHFTDNPPWAQEHKAKYRAYYRDPIVEWIDVTVLAHPEAFEGGPLPGSGYYVMPHCGHPECCRPDGPFESVEAAREWSRNHPERGELA